MKEKTLNTFINELSSSSPVPGGGSVGALCASLSSALTSMVLNLTVGKKIYENYNSEEKKLVDEALAASKKNTEGFMKLITKDMEAFTELMHMYKLPKNTEEEKSFRESKLQEGYENAMGVPLVLAEKSLEFYDYILVACKLGNKNVLSDAGVAAITLQAAIETSIMNVRVNLAFLHNKDEVVKVEQHCCDILKKGEEKKQEIVNIVYKSI